MNFAARIALIAAACAALVRAQGGTQPKAFQPKAAPEQPVPFSHKTHTAAGVKCLDCHTIRPPGDAAGLPAERVCMGCHASIKTDSAAIQKLASAAREKKTVAWVRVYRLPRTVYFSHEV